MKQKKDEEIEIRVRISRSRYNRLTNKLKSVARFVKSSQQIDEYLQPEDRPFMSSEFPFQWVSVRRRNGQILFNYKHFYPEHAPVKDYCKELEVDVGDAEVLKRILASLGFRALIKVEKFRKIYNFNDEVEIAVDSVKGLGVFVELEAMQTSDDVAATKRRLCEVASILGLDTSQIDTAGYPHLLLQQKFGENQLKGRVLKQSY